jgi:hypothetical protein
VGVAAAPIGVEEYDMTHVYFSLRLPPSALNRQLNAAPIQILNVRRFGDTTAIGVDCGSMEEVEGQIEVMIKELQDLKRQLGKAKSIKSKV